MIICKEIWALLLKGQKGGGGLGKVGLDHLAQYHYHMLLATGGMGKGERENTSAGSRAQKRLDCAVLQRVLPWSAYQAPHEARRP